MEMIQKIFPFSFNFKAKDVNGLVVSILIYIVGMILSGVAMFVLGLIPIVGILIGPFFLNIIRRKNHGLFRKTFRSFEENEGQFCVQAPYALF